MPLTADGYSVINVTSAMPSDLSMYDEMPLDEHCRSRSRFRRFSQYRFAQVDGDWHVERLPHRSFIQMAAYNKLVGGVKRDFPPMTLDPDPFMRLAAREISLDKGRAWLVNCHQIRVIAGNGVTGTPVPEGPHRDGFDYIMIACLQRRRIEGGTTELMPLGGGEPFYRTLLEPGQAVIMDDGRMYHHATDLSAGDREGGYRDILIVAFIDWARRKYGPEYEQEAMPHA